jgi:hypothetical protein
MLELITAMEQAKSAFAAAQAHLTPPLPGIPPGAHLTPGFTDDMPAIA